MSNKRWALCFLAVILICAGVIVWQSHGTGSRAVVISQDGAVIQTIDLDRVKEPYTVTIEWQGGHNVILVTGHTVEVTQADCDNQVCVAHGPLKENGSPITCLPHRLVISWKESGVIG